MHNRIYSVVNKNGISLTVIATDVNHVKKLITAAGQEIATIRDVGKAARGMAAGILD